MPVSYTGGITGGITDNATMAFVQNSMLVLALLHVMAICASSIDHRSAAASTLCVSYTYHAAAVGCFLHNVLKFLLITALTMLLHCTVGDTGCASRLPE
jgi:hypothetical protein